MAIFAVDTDGVSGSYSSLNAALAALPATFTADNTITLAASTSVKDTTSCAATVIDTTSSYTLTITPSDDNYIYSPADTAELSFIHSFGMTYNITIDGVQFEKPSMSANYQPILSFDAIRDGVIIVKNSSFISQQTGTARERLIETTLNVSYNATLTIVNNYLRTKGTSTSTAVSCINHGSDRPTYVYNNTFVGRRANLTNASNALYINNIIDTVAAGGTVSGSSDYNMFSGAFDFSGTNDEQSQSFTFTDLSSDDVHLESGDTGARGKATDLSSDANFAFDYDQDNVTRSAWDAGAFEFVSGGVELTGNLEPIFSSGGQITQSQVIQGNLEPIFTSAGQIDQSQTLVGNLEPVFLSAGQIEQSQEIQGNLQPIFTSGGQIVQVTGVELVGNLEPIFTSAGEIEQTQFIVGNLEPIFTSGGQIEVVGDVELVGNLQPIFTSSGEITQAQEIQGNLEPIFTTGGRIVVDGELDLDNALLLGTYTPEERLTLASYTPTDKLILGTYTR